jgi:hypothetical protein
MTGSLLHPLAAIPKSRRFGFSGSQRPSGLPDVSVEIPPHRHQSGGDGVGIVAGGLLEAFDAGVEGDVELGELVEGGKKVILFALAATALAAPIAAVASPAFAAPGVTSSTPSRVD